MLHPELRKHLDHLGATIKAGAGGQTEVRVPGADAAFVFHPDGRVFRSGSGQRFTTTGYNQELNRGGIRPDFNPVNSVLEDVVHGHFIHSGDNHHLNTWQTWRQGRLETHVALRVNNGGETVYHEHSDSTHPFTGTTPTTPTIHHLARAALETRDKTPLNMLVDEVADHNGVSHLIGPERFAKRYAEALAKTTNGSSNRLN